MDIIKQFPNKRKNSKYETAIEILMSYVEDEHTRDNILIKLTDMGIDTAFLDKKEEN